jgi:hypothetical protein
MIVWRRDLRIYTVSLYKGTAMEEDTFGIAKQMGLHKQTHTQNSVAFSSQVNYTDWADIIHTQSEIIFRFIIIDLFTVHSDATRYGPQNHSFTQNRSTA